MSTTSALLSRYKSVQVTTSSPVQLVVMLYDGIFRFVREARDAHEKQDRPRFTERVGRVHSIVELLLSSLEREAFPELTERLEGVYGFCLERAMTAGVQFKTEPLADIERVLEPLREAWRTTLLSEADKKR